MKKILFLLSILSFSFSYGQTTLANKLRITGNITSATATKINVQEANGEVNTIAKSDLTDVLKYANALAFPLTGVVGKIYYAIDTDLYYKWDGATYEEFGGGGTETDPLALKIASNLGDLSNVPTARTNLGLGDLATQNGNFSDKANLASPTFTGSVQVPNGSLSTEAVNKGQLDAVSSSNTWITTGNNIANNNSGNVGIGTGATAPSSKLTVFGDVDFKTAGGGGISRFLFNTGTSQLTIGGGSGTVIARQYSGSGSGTDFLFDNSNNNYTFSIGNLSTAFTTAKNALNFTKTLTVSSGSARFNILALNPTINQTGTSTSILGGIYINPTLTSDLTGFRSLDITGGKIYLPPTLDTGSGSEKMLVKDGTTGQVKELDIPSGSGSTNLSITYTASDVTIVSSSGTDATVNAVDVTNAGVVTPTQKSTWDGKQDAIGFTPANDANVVHISGSETIVGAKEFSENITISNATGKSFFVENTTDESTQLGLAVADGSPYLKLNNSGSSGVTLKADNATDYRVLQVPNTDGTLATNSYADAKVTQTITNGVTTTAPSEDVVFDALAGKQPLDSVLTNTTASFTTAQETKLDGIEVGATANSSDIALLDRFNHTGTQLSSTISDFNSATRAQTEAELVAGSNITITPSGSGATRQLTIASTGGGGGATPQTGHIIVTSGTSFTTPANITTSTVWYIELVGGGGGGGGTATVSGGTGSGGGGGGYCFRRVTGLNPSTTYTCAIGTGGAGGGAAANGTNGGNTTLSLGGGIGTLEGGAGGAGIGAVSSDGGAGGNGLNGDIIITGEFGEDSGTSSTITPGAKGGNSPKGWGQGGRKTRNGVNGSNGTGYGAGGAGGRGNAVSGGSGTSGIIYAVYFN